MSRIYHGQRIGEGGARVNVIQVTVEGVWLPSQPLPPCFNLRNHSPDGFEWGYNGSGPAQLALAILVDHYAQFTPPEHKKEAEQRAMKLYQTFKERVIAPLKMDEWYFTTEHVSRHLSCLPGLGHNGGRDSVPCRWCLMPTFMTGTEECDGCHELRVRVEMDHHMAARMLAPWLTEQANALRRGGPPAHADTVAFIAHLARVRP